MVLDQQRILVLAGLLQTILYQVQQILVIGNGGFQLARAERNDIVHCPAKTLNELLLPRAGGLRSCLAGGPHREEL